ncbi:spore cortex biosynthesis protein YabQ [Alkalihalobacillus oceani]|uniref:Spore cortex biosynthesis protein YabQ n=1 Tax=Halalkalibacter oceani TaxID=1653776 RepID=A0A9X2DRU8_9BACI|nr:spore cortex biosynthesis protein YabQ [Halalkalibacter oceani]
MSLSVQLYTMLSMIAMGSYIGAAIDTYHRFSKRRSSFHWFVACNDVMFWLMQALVVFYVLLQTNHGEIRFYVFLALICGYAAYQAMLRPFYRGLLERCIMLTVSIYKGIVTLFRYLVMKPVTFILKLLYSLCMMIVTGCTAVILFLLRLVLVPLRGLALLLLKWTGLLTYVKKSEPIFAKIKEFIKSMRKKKE